MPGPPISPPGGASSQADGSTSYAASPDVFAPAKQPLARSGAGERPAAVFLAARLRTRGVLDLIALAGMLVFSLFLFWARVRLDGGFFNGDILTAYIPLYTVVAERLQAGDVPGWNPAFFSGMPLAGDPVSAWGYLPAMATFLLFGPVGAFQAFVFIHLLLAGVATYLLGRRLGLSVLGSLAAGIAYELGPLVYFTKCCTAYMQIGPWIPAGMLTVEMGLRAGSRQSRILWWGATGFVISQMIAGFFGKGAYYGVLAVGAFLVYRTVIDPPEPLGLRPRVTAAVSHGAAVLGFGLALSAINVLPRLEFIGRANLAGGSYDAVDPEAGVSAGWTIGRALTSVLNPGDPKYYVGAVVLTLAIAGAVYAGRRHAAPFFVLLSAFALTLTLRHTPVHSVAYLLPRFEVIHQHVAPRVLMLFMIGPAILAGAAVTAIQGRRFTPARHVAAVFTIMLAAGTIAVLADREDVRFVADVRTSIAMVVLFLGVVVTALALWRSRQTRYANWMSAAVAAALVIALAWNLGSATFERARDRGLGVPPLGAVPLAYADRTDAGGAGEFLSTATSGDPARYLGYDAIYLNGLQRDSTYYHAWEDDLSTEALLVNNRAILLGVEDAQGYNPVHPMRYVEYFDTMNGDTQEYHETNLLPSGIGSPLFDLLNVRYLVVPSQLPPGRPDLLRLSQLYPTVFDNGEVRVLENRSALPRAWIVHEAEQVATDDVLPLLASGEIDVRSTALLEAAVPPLEQPADPGTGSVMVTHYEPDRITLTTSTTAAGLLVMSEMHDPGWHVYVDGERASAMVANYLFRSVPLPAGVHTVEWRYEPRSLTVGLGITTLTGAGLLALAIYSGVTGVYRRSGDAGGVRRRKWASRA